jgi:hypothetical protein
VESKGFRTITRNREADSDCARDQIPDFLSASGCQIDDIELPEAGAEIILTRRDGADRQTDRLPTELATSVSAQIQSNIRHDLRRIPYTLMILECTR